MQKSLDALILLILKNAIYYLPCSFQQSSGICHIYNGSICRDVLSNAHVFVSPNLTMNDLEERLKAAYGVIKESK